jgi:hypothetical protein
MVIQRKEGRGDAHPPSQRAAAAPQLLRLRAVVKEKSQPQCHPAARHRIISAIQNGKSIEHLSHTPGCLSMRCLNIDFCSSIRFRQLLQLYTRVIERSIILKIEAMSLLFPYVPPYTMFYPATTLRTPV